VALRERAERAESSAAELRARAERAEAQRSSDQPTWIKEQARAEQVARYEVYAMRHAAVQENEKAARRMASEEGVADQAVLLAHARDGKRRREG
jgi:hypothetical protein